MILFRILSGDDNYKWQAPLITKIIIVQVDTVDEKIMKNLSNICYEDFEVLVSEITRIVSVVMFNFNN